MVDESNTRMAEASKFTDSPSIKKEGGEGSSIIDDNPPPEIYQQTPNMLKQTLKKKIITPTEEASPTQEASSDDRENKKEPAKQIEEYPNIQNQASPKAQKENVDYNDVELILLKKTHKYSYDLDVITKKQQDGKIKVFLGIDKIRKHDKNLP